jgi:hypothetical protein
MKPIANAMLGMLARLIWVSSRPERVQLDAYRAIRLLHALAAPFYRLAVAQSRRKDWRPAMLNRMLSVFTRIDPRFALHVDVENVELPLETARRHGGMLVCTGHFSLTLAGLKPVRDLGLRPMGVGSAARGTAGWNWGSAAPVEMIDAGRPDVMARCTQSAAAGDMLVAYVDYAFGEGEGRDRVRRLAVSPNMFAWAALRRVPVLFLAARLAPSGRIVLEFAQPRHHVPASRDEAEACAEEFRAFISARTGHQHILRRPRRGPAAEALSPGMRGAAAIRRPRGAAAPAR